MSLLSSSLTGGLTTPISITFPSSLTSVRSSSSSSSSSSSLISSSSETVRALALLNTELHTKWVNQCRAKLIKTEALSIKSRVQHWRRVVNDKTNAINERLNIYIAPDAFPTFDWQVDPGKLSLYLAFVTRWCGLKMKQIKHVPGSYEEYERKARNWLNGRRAPNYAGTLFPDLIKSAQQYAELIARHIFGANNQYSSNYQKILIYGYLHALCSVRISMNDVSKKTYLLCENSIKSNSATALALQSYATDHPFAEYFPSHLKQASDYFQNKHITELERFSSALRVAAGNKLSVTQSNPSMTTSMTTILNNTNVGNRSLTTTSTTTTTAQDPVDLTGGMTGILRSLQSMQSMPPLTSLVAPPPPSVTNVRSMTLSSTPTQTQTPKRQQQQQQQTYSQMNGLKNAVLCNWPFSSSSPSKSDIMNMRGTHSSSSSSLNFQSPLSNAATTTSTTTCIVPKTPPKVVLNAPYLDIDREGTDTAASTSTSTVISMPENVFVNTKICVNGQLQTIGSFLTLIVNKCNHQHVEMQNLHKRLQLMEQAMNGSMKVPKIESLSPRATVTSNTHNIDSKNQNYGDDDETTQSGTENDWQHQSSGGETIDDDEAAVLLSSLRHKVVTQNMNELRIIDERKRSLDEVTNVADTDVVCKKRKIT